MPAFTDEQNQAIQNMLSEHGENLKTTITGIVNSAISSRDKMADKKFNERFDQFNKSLDEKLTALVKPNNEGGEGGEGGGKGGKGKKDDVQIATMLKQQEDLKSRLEAAEARERDAINKNRRTALDQTTTDHLVKMGVDPKHVRQAIAFLRADDRIGYEDEESDRAIFRDDAGTAFDLKMGLSTWVKSEDAKLYLATTGMRGSGSRPVLGGGNGDGKPKSQQEKMQAISDALNNHDFSR